MSLVPYVIEQTSRGERSYDIYSRLLKDRIISWARKSTMSAQALSSRSFCSLRRRTRARISSFISTAPAALLQREWQFTTR